MFNPSINPKNPSPIIPESQLNKKAPPKEKTENTVTLNGLTFKFKLVKGSDNLNETDLQKLAQKVLSLLGRANLLDASKRQGAVITGQGIKLNGQSEELKTHKKLNTQEEFKKLSEFIKDANKANNVAKTSLASEKSPAQASQSTPPPKTPIASEENFTPPPSESMAGDYNIPAPPPSSTPPKFVPLANPTKKPLPSTPQTQIAKSSIDKKPSPVAAKPPPADIKKKNAKPVSQQKLSPQEQIALSRVDVVPLRTPSQTRQQKTVSSINQAKAKLIDLKKQAQERYTDYKKKRARVPGKDLLKTQFERQKVETPKTPIEKLTARLADLEAEKLKIQSNKDLPQSKLEEIDRDMKTINRNLEILKKKQIKP